LLRKTQKNTRSFTTFCVEINVLNIIKGRSSLFQKILSVPTTKRTILFVIK
jgi:hypothetical protein